MEKRIGFGPRFGAAVIDMVVITVVNMVIGTTIAGMMGVGMVVTAGSMGDKTDPAAAAAAAAGMISGMIAGILAMAAVGAIIGLVYFLIEGFTGATPGKMILGLKVGTPEGKAGNVSLYMKRWAIKNAPNLLMLLATILAMVGIGDPGGIISIIAIITSIALFIGAFLIFGASKQCLHDKLAATAIFKKADLTA